MVGLFNVLQEAEQVGSTRKEVMKNKQSHHYDPWHTPWSVVHQCPGCSRANQVESSSLTVTGSVTIFFRYQTLSCTSLTFTASWIFLTVSVIFIYWMSGFCDKPVFPTEIFQSLLQPYLDLSLQLHFLSSGGYKCVAPVGCSLQVFFGGNIYFPFS